MIASDIPEMHRTPEDMARSLCTYIADPARVRREVLAWWSTSPSLAAIRGMRNQYVTSRRRLAKDPTEWDEWFPKEEKEAAKAASDIFLAAIKAERGEVEELEDAPTQPPPPLEFAPPKKEDENPFIGRPVAPRLIASVAADFGQEPDDILGPNRRMDFTATRAVVAALLREIDEDQWTFPVIARALGRTDHSTPINLIQRLPYYRERFPEVDASYRRHRAMLDAARAERIAA